MSPTTRRYALDGPEYATSAVAAVVSSTLYVTQGYPYLARGVVGDLLGFVVLAVAARVLERRLRHEAAVCLAGILVVLAVSPDWPLRLRESVWWGLFVLGLLGYVAVRRRACD